MRRPVRRLAMALVGGLLLFTYVGAAMLGYLGLRFIWESRPDPVTIVVIVGGAALLSGYLSYRFGTAHLLSSLDVREIPRPNAPGLHARVERLVAAMDVEQPPIYVAQMPVPNALAVGGPGGGALVLDRLLFRLLTAAELEAIIAHELAHLESHDSLLQSLAYSLSQTVIGLVTLVLLPAMLLVTGVARAWAWIRGRPLDRESVFDRLARSFGHGIGLLLFAFTIGIRTHSRQREFAADDRAVEVTGDPMALATALRKIEHAADPTWGLFGPLSMRRQEDDEQVLHRILATHPPIDERIDRLLENAEMSKRRPVRSSDGRGIRIILR